MESVLPDLEITDDVQHWRNWSRVTFKNLPNFSLHSSMLQLVREFDYKPRPSPSFQRKHLNLHAPSLLYQQVLDKVSEV